MVSMSMSAGLLSVVAGVFVIAAGAYLVALYNSLVEVRNNTGKAWKNIDVLLQQRHDELPKLIDTTKGYLRHEADVLKRITRLRAGYDGTASIDEKTRIENELNRELGRLRVAVEAYPDLKASAVFTQVTGRVSALESAIADRRELFNDSVNIYNTRIEQFPELLVASVLGYRRQAFLEVPADRTGDVRMNFA
jgi:LemA protein